jgi:hypothetical protein
MAEPQSQFGRLCRMLAQTAPHRRPSTMTGAPAAEPTPRSQGGGALANFTVVLPQIHDSPGASDSVDG